MKKGLSLLLMAMMMVLPLNVRAAQSIYINPDEIVCTADSSNGRYNCTVPYEILDEAISEVNVTLTGEGGAEIISAETYPGSEWTVAKTTPSGSVWTVNLESIGVTGEGTLFRFSYRPSGTDNCRVVVSVNGTQASVTPPKKDEPTDNKQTGATLPYIALGTMAVVAVGAYIAVRNKAKMYRI